MLIQVLNGNNIGDDIILEESMTLTESLCSAQTLTLGACEASTFKIQLRTQEELKGKQITVINHDIQYGVYTVIEDKPTADRTAKEITAKDAIYEILNTDVTEWYIGIFEDAESISLKDFRDSFFEYFGVEQEAADLPLDDLMLSNTIQKQQISGKDIITAICEANGCFGHIGRDGKMQYKRLQYSLVPSEELYPSEDLYPGSWGIHEDIEENLYISCTYSDFATDEIAAVKVLDADGSVLVEEGSGTQYVLDNFILYGKTAEELAEYVPGFLEAIAECVYRPYEAELMGKPGVEVGTAIIIHTDQMDVESYVLERELKGVDALIDKFKAKGTKLAEKAQSSVKNSIRNLQKEQVIQADRIEAAQIRVGELEADNVTIHGSLNAQDARIGEIEADYIKTAQLDAVSARIETIESDYITTGELNAHTIDANKIVSGTIDAARISANTFSGRVIASSGLNTGSVTCSTYNVASDDPRIGGKTLKPLVININGQDYAILAAAL